MCNASKAISAPIFLCYEKKHFSFCMYKKKGTYLVQTKDLVQTRAKLLKKVSKNSKKNHECAPQLTSSVYKILWSNSSYSKSYKKDKFSDNNNGSNASQICLFCNF